MASLAKVVLDAQKSAKSNKRPPKDDSTVATTNDDDDSTATPVNHVNDAGLTNPNTNGYLKSNLSSSGPRQMQSSYKGSPIPHPLTTPSERTGPPRSISFNSLPNSRVVSRSNSRTEPAYPAMEGPSTVAGPSTQPNQNHRPRPLELDRTESQFRDALEYDDPDQREREREYFEGVEKRKARDSRLEEWNPIRWLTDSPRDTPKEEHPRFYLEPGSESEKEKGERRPKLAHPMSAQHEGVRPQRRRDTPRSRSLPPAPMRRDSKDKEKRTSIPKWGRLRSLLPAVITQSHSHASQAGGSSALAQQSVNITDELITGNLAALMLKLWFERDEKGHRRVPILLHRLRIRISDSLHPLDGNKAVFRIECEYANGAARWVVYRQLREFVSLHTHYTFSNAYNRNVAALPEFPKTSERATSFILVIGFTCFLGLPYFKFLKREGREKGNKVGHAEFARMQREVLENYLVGLIRAVVMHSPAFVFSEPNPACTDVSLDGEQAGCLPGNQRPLDHPCTVRRCSVQGWVPSPGG